MKILWITKHGDAASIALRQSLDGDQIRFYIDDPKYKTNFDGLLIKADTWQKYVQWADLIIFGDNECSNIWKQVHNLKPCFGGSAWGEKLEKDRAFGRMVMREIGLEDIESLTFKTASQVAAHIREHKVKHVIKPQGKKVDSYHVIISDDKEGSDAIALLESLSERNIPVESFEVEERIEGVELGCSAWCAGNAGFVGPTNLNFEHKRMNHGDKGPLTGEAGTLMRYNHDQEHTYFLETLKKLEPLIKRMDYRGQIDLNMIAIRDEMGNVHYKPLEWTPRLGFPSVFLESELHITPWTKIFYDIACGKDPHLQTSFDWCVGIVLFALGHPFDQEVERISTGLPILGVSDLDHTYLWQVSTDKKERLVVGRGDGYILTTTGKGEVIHSAQETALDCMNHIKVPNSTYRTDIGNRVLGLDLVELGVKKVHKPIGEDLKPIHASNTSGFLRSLAMPIS